MRKIYFITLLFISLVSNAQVTTTTPTGSSTEVGVTEGELSVSLTGSASYNIPIAVPPGINGVEPKIGLSYNSNAGNGIAGYGWNISGLSAITRIPSTKYHDNNNDPVDFDALDRFALDGQRLIKKSGTTGTYGANNTVYETEVFSNVKITSYGVHPNGANYGPAYFIVQYPDGSLAHFGNSTDSRSITIWSITYWQNAQGLRINYFYTLLNNNMYVSTIKYGNVGVTQTLNEIVFTYSDRISPEQGYIAGQNIENKKILSNIQIKGNAISLRNYLLEYTTNNLQYQRLSKLYEKNGNNSISYNPTVFNYGDSNSDSNFTSKVSLSTSAPGADYKIISGDFDEDGKTDFIYYNKFANFTNAFNVYKDLEGFNSSITSPFNWDNTITNSPLTAYLGNNNSLMVESFNSVQLTGNSTNDYKLKNGWSFAIKNPSTGINPTNTYSIKSYFLDSNENIVLNDTKTITNDRWCGNTKGKFIKFLPGDFNGDGITDVIGISTLINNGIFSNCSKKEVYFIDLKKDITSNYYQNCGEIPQINVSFPNINWYNNEITENTQIEVINFDGDNRSDFLLLDGNGIRVFTLSPTGNTLILLFSNIFTSPDFRTYYTGDFNGDGKTDIVIANNMSDFWTFYIATGVGFSTFTKSIGLVHDTNNGTRIESYNYNPNCIMCGFAPEPIHQTYYAIVSNYIVKDMNGDGKSDIVCQRNKVNGFSRTRSFTAYYPAFSPTLQYSYSEWVENHSGEGSITNILNKYYSPYSISATNIEFAEGNSNIQILNTINSPIKFLDVKDTDPISREIIYVRGNQINIFSKNFKKENLLTKITTGNGVEETITYKPLKQEDDFNSTVYIPSSKIENYPNYDIGSTSNFMVVSKTEKQSGSSYKQRKFAYFGAVSNIDGLGFLGFRQVTQTNWHNLTDEVYSDIYKFDINLRGNLIKKYKLLDYIVPSTSNLEFDPRLKSISIYTYNTASEAILPNKVFKVKLNQSQEIDGVNYTSIITDYPLFNVYNQPTSSVATIKNGTTTEKIVNSTFEYEHFPTAATYIVGRPTSKTKTATVYPNQTNQDVLSSEELYTYNPSHLLSQIKTKTTNSGITTNYLTQDNSYDPYGNLTKKKITALGLPSRETNYEYRHAYGYRFLTKSIDVDGLETNYTYNNATGSLLTETLPSNSGFPLTTTYSYDVWGKKTNTLNFLGNNQTVEYLKQNEKTLVTTTTIVADGNSVSTELLDDLGRKIQSGAKTLNGDMSYVDYEYDNFNRPIKVSEPHFEGDTALWNQTSYDNYGRVNQTITAAGKTTTISYTGLTTTINDGTKTKVTVKNAVGNVISLTETPGGTVTYQYFANDNLKSSTADGATTTIIQDGWGRKKELHDPAAGVYKYTYNDLGEITKEENPNGFTEYTYYPTGKLHTKWVKNAAQPTTTNINSTYAYDTTTKMLSSITVENPNDGNNTFSYTYDDRRRLLSTTEEYTTIQPRTFSKNLTFDDYGRIATETVTASAFGKSTTKTTCNTYLNGFNNQIFDGATPTGTPVWKANTQDARGTTIEQTYGNGTFRSDQIDEFGYPVYTELKRAQFYLMQLSNDFDEPKGNLTNRTNSLFAWNEPFDYDTADRLTQYNNNLGQSITQDYFDSGKIQTNNLGTYNYTDADNPFKNTSLSDLTIDGQTFANRNQAVTYNAFNSPIDITQSNERVSFGYNALQQRSVMYYGNNIVNKQNRSLRKYYSADGSIEIKYTKATTTVPEKVEFFTYIGGDAYSAPLVVRKIDNGIYENFYLHRDHLGSILAITNSAGAIIEKRLFDAWGKILKIQNGSGATLTRFAFFDRGYTGHEHMQGVALINMNGRVYDPQLHRFLQPDNNIQDPFNTQNHNRYGYVLNNPLKYTDESGEFWGFVLGAILNAYISTAQSTGEGNIFKWDAATWQSAGFNVASSGATYGATNYANSYIDNYGSHPEIESSPVKSNQSSGLATGNEMSVNFFSDKPDQINFNSVFMSEHDRFNNSENENVFRVYGHGGNGSIFYKNNQKSIGKSKTFDKYMSMESNQWSLKKDNNETILILYSCLSASAPGGKSIGQKVSNLHKNITVVAFDGYVRYDWGMFNGRIDSVSKQYSKNDGMGEMVIYRGGVEIHRSLFQSPWEYYFRSLRFQE